MNVLAAPAEYYFRPGNYHISYNIISRLRNINFTIISSYVDNTIKKIPNAKIVELKTSWSLYMLKVFLAAKKYEKQADVVHHLSPFPIGKDFNIFVMHTKKPVVIGPLEKPHIFFEDESEIFKVPNFLKKLKDCRAREKLSSKTLESADTLIAVNRETRKYLLNYTDKQNVKIIPLGVNTEFFKSSQVPNNYKIITVGIHIIRKGFDYLIKAMPEIIKEFPETELHITSTGPRTTILKNLATKLGIHNNVIFHGRVSDQKLLQLYHSSRVFCHPSLSESFSPVRLEAMATGRPIIATNTASGSEELIDKKCGILVKPADPHCLAEAIKKLFDDYELCVRMGRHSRRKVEKYYSWEIVATKYLKIYESLA